MTSVTRNLGLLRTSALPVHPCRRTILRPEESTFTHGNSGRIDLAGAAALSNTLAAVAGVHFRKDAADSRLQSQSVHGNLREVCC